MARVKRHVAGAVVFGTLALGGTVARSMDAPRPAVETVDARRIREADIEFYRRRTARDTLSARDFAELAGLYLQRGRTTASGEDLLRAEAHARRSLRLRAGRNGAALGTLASALLAQHRFPEALEAARRLAADDPASVGARGLLGEIELELGDYGAATRTLGGLALLRRDLGVAPRLARWEELRGRPEMARRILREARNDAAHRHGVPREQVAWFHLRLGDLALRYGHLAEAERELRAGLVLAPGDYRLLGAMAGLEAARHDWPGAIEQGEAAIARALDPATLGLVGDAYAALGDSARAADCYRAMEVAVLHQPGPFHRAWSLFLLDHGRDVPTVLARAREELVSRRDIYGYDLVAWALHRSGRDDEAQAPMDSALALGTRDATLFFHAGMIARARGDDAQAKHRLRAALETNPFWHPLQPATARAVLDSLR